MKMSHFSPVHALLQCILLISFFVAAHGVRKNFEVMIVNLSKRKFDLAAKDENGNVKVRQTNFIGTLIVRWRITSTSRSTVHTCHLTHDDEGVKKTTSFVVFYEQEEQRWLSQTSDHSGSVFWTLKDEGLCYTNPRTGETVFYKTWQALELQQKRLLKCSITNLCDKLSFSMVVMDVGGVATRTRRKLSSLDSDHWEITGLTRATYYTCRLRYGEYPNRKTVTFELFKERDEHLWLKQDTDKTGHVIWYLKDDGVHGLPIRDGKSEIFITWAQLESTADDI